MVSVANREALAPAVAAQDLAARLHEARLEGRVLEGSDRGPQLSLPEAYSVQDELTSLHLAAGREIAGYKLGYTSLAMRQQMGVAAPNFGPLYADMFVRSDCVVDGFIQPRLEPEVAVVLGHDLEGAGLLLHEVAGAISQLHACMEIVDSVWKDYRFSAAQNTADGSSAAGVVLGEELDVRPYDCHRIGVQLEVDGRLVATATGAAAGGHPLHGVAWLCERLAERGSGLLAGQIIITGGLTPAIPLHSGSRVQATYGSRSAARVIRA